MNPETGRQAETDRSETNYRFNLLGAFESEGEFLGHEFELDVTNR